MAVTKLTETIVRNLPLGSGIHRDADVKGLMVICHKKTKTYACQGDVRRNGRHIRTVRVKLDRADRIGLAAARRKAKGVMSTIQSGIDPTDKLFETAITLEQVMETHINERQLSEVTAYGYRYHLDKYLRKFRNRAMADITRIDCRELFDKIEATSGRPTASTVMRTMRAMFNTAMRLDETIERSPVDAVRIPTTNRRVVGELDIASWWAKTEDSSPILRDLHRVFLLTGARRSTLTTVKREHVDFQKDVIRFTHMKTGGELLFPFGPKLKRLLQDRMDADYPLNSDWLWPSQHSKAGHIVETRQDDQPSAHVLRHHARTLMIAAGVPYAESALLLGQRLPGASGGYVHQSHLAEALRPHATSYEDYIFSKTYC